MRSFHIPGDKNPGLQNLQDNNPRRRITRRSRQVTLFISSGASCRPRSIPRKSAAAGFYLAAPFFPLKAALVGGARLTSWNPALRQPGCPLDNPLELFDAVLEIAPLAAIPRGNNDKLAIPVKAARVKASQALSNRRWKPVGAFKMEAHLCPG